MAIRVLVCDDHTMLRQGLEALLGRESGLEVVGEAGDGAEGVVALLHITMPGMNGIGAARAIHRLALGSAAQ
jgi:DNA-binding NarL/FixJ family response regulator